MRNCFSAIFIFLLLGFHWNEEQPNKVALLIGINQYAVNSGWPTIHGENDLVLIEKVLLKRGFLKENIHVLKGEQATKINIFQQLKKISKTIARGGFFLFHFSGHGQQVKDQWSELIDEADGLDEALVLFDAPKLITNHYRGAKHLLDDDLTNYLSPISTQLGDNGQILSIIDACHSGTISRGSNDFLLKPIRGITQPLGKVVTSEIPTRIKENTGYFEQNKIRNGNASLVVISATRPNETNRECKINGEYYGPLSAAFSEVFSTTGNINYQQFFKRIQDKMYQLVMHQSPCIEGNQALLVGQNTLLPVTETSITPILKRGNYLSIDAGQLHSIHAGTELSFWQGDTLLVAKGKVVESFPLDAMVQYKLENGSRAEHIESTKIIRQDFGDLAVSVGLKINDQAFGAKLLEKIATIDAIQIVKKEADIIIQQQNDSIHVSSDGVIIHQLALTNSQKIINQIIENILLQYAQIHYLNNLHFKNEDYKLTGRLVLVKDQKQPILYPLISSDKLEYNKENQLVVPVKSVYQLEVTNEGKKNAYLSVLDISPNATFTVAIPFDDGEQIHKKPEDYLIPKDSTILLPGDYWDMYEPLGIEQYLFIATDEPIDLQKLHTNKGQSSLGTTNAFEKLFKKSWNRASDTNKNRAGKMPPVIAQEINVERIFVEIVAQD